MADTSQMEQLSPSEPQTNGIPDGIDEDEKMKMRPADIDADMREMERRKRVEMIMNSRLFREELERIIETQLKDGSGPAGLLQQISDMMGIQGGRLQSGNVFRSSNCVVPINDIRGVESMGYAKGEKILRCKLAAVYRLMDLYGWTQGIYNHITARLNQDQEHFLVNPFGMLYHEITASSLVKIDMQGGIVESGTTNFGVNVAGFMLHSAIHAARPDVKCIIHVHTPSVLAVSSLKCGLLPLCQEAIVIGEVSHHPYLGGLFEPEEREKIARNLGPVNKVMFLANHGAVCCGETIEEAFYNVYNTVLACETQIKLMPMGVDNLVLVSDENRKQLYEAARRAPDSAPKQESSDLPPSGIKKEKPWRIGGIEFEALMRMLDNAGFRTGYIYRHPLVKGELPRPRNDVEVPPAVSSLGYLLEEEEMYKHGQWKKYHDGRKTHDRTRWLNSPNVYQKVEILETGTPDPKKITKWVADGSPTHTSTPVKIDAALQFVPKNTDPREFKKLQQQIKDNRRADKITSGPQSHILEGVSWEEAKKLQDANISATGDQVILVGAASKGIIQRGFQHNAMVYKTPYAKNPFDTITDEDIEEYKKTVERKQRGESFDEDQTESEPLSSSLQNSRPTNDDSGGVIKSPLLSPTSAASETEEESRDEPRVLRIETKQVPRPSQAEVVLSDAESDFPDPSVERSMSLRYPEKVADATDVSDQFKRSWSLGPEKVKSKDSCQQIVDEFSEEKTSENPLQVPKVVRYLISRYNDSIAQKDPLVTATNKRKLTVVQDNEVVSNKISDVLLKLQAKIFSINSPISPIFKHGNVDLHSNSVRSRDDMDIEKKVDVSQLQSNVFAAESSSNSDIVEEDRSFEVEVLNSLETYGVVMQDGVSMDELSNVSSAEEAVPSDCSGARLSAEETELHKHFDILSGDDHVRCETENSLHYKAELKEEENYVECSKHINRPEKLEDNTLNVDKMYVDSEMNGKIENRKDNLGSIENNEPSLVNKPYHRKLCNEFQHSKRNITNIESRTLLFYTEMREEPQYIASDILPDTNVLGELGMCYNTLKCSSDIAVISSEEDKIIKHSGLDTWKSECYERSACREWNFLDYEKHSEDQCVTKDVGIECSKVKKLINSKFCDFENRFYSQSCQCKPQERQILANNLAENREEVMGRGYGQVYVKDKVTQENYTETKIVDTCIETKLLEDVAENNYVETKVVEDLIPGNNYIESEIKRQVISEDNCVECKVAKDVQSEDNYVETKIVENVMTEENRRETKVVEDLMTEGCNVETKVVEIPGENCIETEVVKFALPEDNCIEIKDVLEGNHVETKVFEEVMAENNGLDTKIVGGVMAEDNCIETKVVEHLKTKASNVESILGEDLMVENNCLETKVVENAIPEDNYIKTMALKDVMPEEDCLETKGVEHVISEYNYVETKICEDIVAEGNCVERKVIEDVMTKDCIVETKIVENVLVDNNCINTKVVEDVLVEENCIETKVVEDVLVEENGIETKVVEVVLVEKNSIETKVVEDLLVEENCIETKVVQDELIEENCIETKVVEDVLVEENGIETKVVEDVLVEDNCIETKVVEDVLVEDNCIETRVVEDVMVGENCVETKIIEDVLVEDNCIETKVVEDVLVEENCVETKVVEDVLVKDNCIETKVVEDVLVEDNCIETKVVEDVLVKDNCIETEVVEGVWVEKNCIESKVVEDVMIEDNCIETKFVEDVLIEENCIETKVVEDLLVGENCIETKVVEDVLVEENCIETKIIEDVLVEDNCIETKVVQDELVLENCIETKVVEDVLVEDNCIETKVVEENCIETKVLEENCIETKVVEENCIETKVVEDVLVEDNCVETKIIEDVLCEDNCVETKVVEDVLVEENCVETKVVEDVPVEDNCIETEVVEGVWVEKNCIESKVVEDVMVEDNCIETEVDDDVMVKDNCIETKVVEGIVTEDNPVETKVIEDAVAEDNCVERKFIENVMVKDCNVETKIVEDVMAEDNYVETQVIEDVMVEDNCVETVVVEDVTTEENCMETKVVEDVMAEDCSVETKVVEDVMTKDCNVETMVGKDVMFEDKCIEMKVGEDVAAEDNSIRCKAVEEVMIKDCNAETKIVKDVMTEDCSVVTKVVADVMTKDNPVQTKVIEDVVADDSCVERKVIEDVMTKDCNVVTKIVEDVMTEDCSLETKVVADVMTKDSNVETMVAEDAAAEDNSIETKVVEDVMGEYNLVETLVDVMTKYCNLETKVVEDVMAEDCKVDTKVVEDVMAEDCKVVEDVMAEDNYVETKVVGGVMTEENCKENKDVEVIPEENCVETVFVEDIILEDYCLESKVVEAVTPEHYCTETEVFEDVMAGDNDVGTKIIEDAKAESKGVEGIMAENNCVETKVVEDIMPEGCNVETKVEDVMSEGYCIETKVVEYLTPIDCCIEIENFEHVMAEDNCIDTKIFEDLMAEDKYVDTKVVDDVVAEGYCIETKLVEDLTPMDCCIEIENFEHVMAEDNLETVIIGDEMTGESCNEVIFCNSKTLNDFERSSVNFGDMKLSQCVTSIDFRNGILLENFSGASCEVVVSDIRAGDPVELEIEYNKDIECCERPIGTVFENMELATKDCKEINIIEANGSEERKSIKSMGEGDILPEFFRSLELLECSEKNSGVSKTAIGNAGKTKLAGSQIVEENNPFKNPGSTLTEYSQMKDDVLKDGVHSYKDREFFNIPGILEECNSGRNQDEHKFSDVETLVCCVDDDAEGGGSGSPTDSSVEDYSFTSSIFEIETGDQEFLVNSVVDELGAAEMNSSTHSIAESGNEGWHLKLGANDNSSTSSHGLSSNPSEEYSEILTESYSSSITTLSRASMLPYLKICFSSSGSGSSSSPDETCVDIMGDTDWNDPRRKVERSHLNHREVNYDPQEQLNHLEANIFGEYHWDVGDSFNFIVSSLEHEEITKEPEVGNKMNFERKAEGVYANMSPRDPTMPSDVQRNWNDQPNYVDCSCDGCSKFQACCCEASDQNFQLDSTRLRSEKTSEQGTLDHPKSTEFCDPNHSQIFCHYGNRDHNSYIKHSTQESKLSLQEDAHKLQPEEEEEHKERINISDQVFQGNHDGNISSPEFKSTSDHFFCLEPQQKQSADDILCEFILVRDEGFCCFEPNGKLCTVQSEQIVKDFSYSGSIQNAITAFNLLPKVLNAVTFLPKPDADISPIFKPRNMVYSSDYSNEQNLHNKTKDGSEFKFDVKACEILRNIYYSYRIIDLFVSIQILDKICSTDNSKIHDQVKNWVKLLVYQQEVTSCSQFNEDQQIVGDTQHDDVSIQSPFYKPNKTVRPIQDYKGIHTSECSLTCDSETKQCHKKKDNTFSKLTIGFKESGHLSKKFLRTTTNNSLLEAKFKKLFSDVVLLKGLEVNVGTFDCWRNFIGTVIDSEIGQFIGATIRMAPYQDLGTHVDNSDSKWNEVGLIDGSRVIYNFNIKQDLQGNISSTLLTQNLEVVKNGLESLYIYDSVMSGIESTQYDGIKFNEDLQTCVNDTNSEHDLDGCSSGIGSEQDNDLDSGTASEHDHEISSAETESEQNFVDDTQALEDGDPELCLGDWEQNLCEFGGAGLEQDLGVGISDSGSEEDFIYEIEERAKQTIGSTSNSRFEQNLGMRYMRSRSKQNSNGNGGIFCKQDCGGDDSRSQREYIAKPELDFVVVGTKLEDDEWTAITESVSEQEHDYSLARTDGMYGPDRLEENSTDICDINSELNHEAEQNTELNDSCLVPEQDFGEESWEDISDLETEKVCGGRAATRLKPELGYEVFVQYSESNQNHNMDANSDSWEHVNNSECGEDDIADSNKVCKIEFTHSKPEQGELERSWQNLSIDDSRERICNIGREVMGADSKQHLTGVGHSKCKLVQRMRRYSKPKRNLKLGNEIWEDRGNLGSKQEVRLSSNSTVPEQPCEIDAVHSGPDKDPEYSLGIKECDKGWEDITDSEFNNDSIDSKQKFQEGGLKPTVIENIIEYMKDSHGNIVDAKSEQDLLDVELIPEEELEADMSDPGFDHCCTDATFHCVEAKEILKNPIFSLGNKSQTCDSILNVCEGSSVGNPSLVMKSNIESRYHESNDHFSLSSMPVSGSKSINVDSKSDSDNSIYSLECECCARFHIDDKLLIAEKSEKTKAALRSEPGIARLSISCSEHVHKACTNEMESAVDLCSGEAKYREACKAGNICTFDDCSKHRQESRNMGLKKEYKGGARHFFEGCESTTESETDSENARVNGTVGCRGNQEHKLGRILNSRNNYRNRNLVCELDLRVEGNLESKPDTGIDSNTNPFSPNESIDGMQIVQEQGKYVCSDTGEVSQVKYNTDNSGCKWSNSVFFDSTLKRQDPNITMVDCKESNVCVIEQKMKFINSLHSKQKDQYRTSECNNSQDLHDSIGISKLQDTESDRDEILYKPKENLHECCLQNRPHHNKECCSTENKSELLDNCSTFYFDHVQDFHCSDAVDTFYIGSDHALALLTSETMSSPKDSYSHSALPRILDLDESFVCDFSNFVDSLEYSPLVHPLSSNIEDCPAISKGINEKCENTVNGDDLDAPHSTFSQSSKEGSPTKDLSTEESPKKDKKKKKGLRTPSFLKKKKEKKKMAEA